MKTLLSLLLLASCAKQTTEQSHKYYLPEGLLDCKVYEMQSEGLGPTLRVVRCPNSQTTTSYKSGKTHMNTTVVEQ